MVAFFITFLGICIGSFLNVLIDRLPKGQNVLWGHSRCDHCRKTLRWFELIPLFSYIIQKGQCRRCKTQLSLQYPTVEIVTGALFYFAYVAYPSMLAQIFSALLFSSLLVIFVADMKYTIIPDSMVILGLLTGLGLALTGSTGTLSVFHRFATAIFAATAFLLLWSLTKGKGLGFGDVKLVLLLGFIAGFPMILVTLYAGFLTGAIAGVILILIGKKKIKSHIAFGPFLILGFVIASLWGNTILVYWMKYIR